MQRLMRVGLAAMAFVAFGASAAAWKIDKSLDKMTDAETRTAMLGSTNSLSLEFPYAGKNHGYLTVRQHPQHGLDVMVGVDKGQIVCGVRDCRLLFRFDGGTPVPMNFARAEGGISTVVFARDPKGLLSRFAKASKVMVQLPMFKAGDQVLEFAADSPLDWPMPAQKARPAGRK